jgi:hypothetical protein
MGGPQLGPEQIQWLSEAVGQYITAQRVRYAPNAVPLTEGQRTALGDFFTAAVLNTRLVTLRGERVANPDFYPALQAMGFDNLPDQSRMGAITFSDIVVSHVPFDNGLLFHELVHVEQYRQLGIERFSQLYGTGFLNGGGDDGIPLERHAYELGTRYEEQPHTPFSVENAVRDSIHRQTY